MRVALLRRLAAAPGGTPIDMPAPSMARAFLFIVIGTAAARINVLWGLVLYGFVLAPPLDTYLARRAPRLLAGLGALCTAFLLWQSGPPLAQLAGQLRHLPAHVQFDNDSVVTTSCATSLFLSGHNPYVDVTLQRCFWQSGYTTNGSLLTPLRLGRFSSVVTYPSPALLDNEWRRIGVRGIARPPEFAWSFSYPAGAFLVPAALWKLGLTDARLFGVLCFGAAYLFLLWRSPRRFWPWILLLGVANPLLWVKAASGSSDALYALLVLVGWSLNRHRVPSAVALGLAVAARQQAWLFLIFYAVLVAVRDGPREVRTRLSIIGALFLLANLPFFVLAPAAWTRGVLGPLVDPMFPRGVGIISIFLGAVGSVPLLPRWLFGVLEVSTLVGCVGVYARVCRRWPHLGLVLAVLPLYVAWRSLSSYFFPVSLFVLGGALDLAGARMVPRLPRSLGRGWGRVTHGIPGPLRQRAGDT